ncbi:protein THEM6-like [Uranotaenia lowii]|uniref:protein THEM6-like n=1 Tax=Uranotaenia lowii TaxID=190385 RepID=UPI0024789181|nr:protein THEM6-like [Uranotaenia lowii]XP_055587776.1 protein THEM6-like [Uranotaenia lowii]
MWWILIALLYIAFDINYFIRVTFTLVLDVFSARNLKLLDTSVSYGICTTQDIDLFLNHMNNARFLRELDFARYHWYGRTRFWDALKVGGATMVQGAATIRYRKMMPIWRPFRVETRLIWWDERSLFLEQRFVSLGDGFVRAVAICRQPIVGANLGDVMADFEQNKHKPEPPPVEIRHWLDAIEESSLKLRIETQGMLFS